MAKGATDCQRNRGAACNSSNWSPRTIKTTLNRLVKKKALGYRSIGREYRYFPRISEEEFVAADIQSFVERVFGGGAGAMVAAFIKHRIRTLIWQAGSQ